MSSPVASFFVRRRGLAAGLALITAGSLGVALAQSNKAATAKPAASTAPAALGPRDRPAGHGPVPRSVPGLLRVRRRRRLAQENPIPADYPSWGTFSELAERNREALHKILEKLAAATGRGRPRGAQDRRFLRELHGRDGVEARERSRSTAELERIDRIASLDELRAEIARLQTKESTRSSSSARSRTARTRARSSRPPSRAASACPTATTTRRPTRNRRKLRDQYVAHVEKIFVLQGTIRPRPPSAHAPFSTSRRSSREASMTRVERRDPDATYHRMTPAAVEGLTPHFSWSAYFRDV